MATNSYSYGSLGERWTVGDPTSKDRLDTARVKNDANRWTLTQLLDDPDDSPFALADGTAATTQSPGNDTTKVATTAFVKAAVDASSTDPGGSNTYVQYNNSGAFGGAANLAWVNGTSTLTVAGTANAKLLNLSASGAALASQNASKIILVDFTDPTTMWDVEIFLARVRHTSWYEELGAPPMRGAIWINNAKRDIVWWNLDTDAVYMTFTAAANNVVGAVDTNDIAFLDGKLYFAQSTGSRLGIVDFLRDHIKKHDESQIMLYKGNVKERNDGNNFLSYNTAASQRILCVNSIYSVAAVRDPLRFDEFDRPEHWWAVSTDASGGSPSVSVYNPITDTIYYGGNLNSSVTSANKPVALSPNGGLVLAVDLGSQEYVNWFSSVYALYADWATGWNEMYLKSGNTFNTHPFSSSVDWAALDICDAPPLGGQSNIVAVGGDEGLVLAFAHTGNDSDKTAIIAVTSSYNTPYMKGARAGAYPLNDANDRGGGGHNLTNNNTVTFASGGPTGSYANFVAASNQSLTLADHADFGGMSELTLSCWFKRDIDSGAAMVLMGKYDTASGSDRSFLLQVDSADKINFQCITSAGSVGASPANPATVIDTWYHVAAIYDGANLKLYLDGVLIVSAAQTGTVVDGTEPFCIGSHTSGSPNANWFDGQIAGVFVGSTAMTEAEVNLEYQRGVRVLGGATAKLANTDVKSIRIDQNSGLAAITTAANQTEIWDVTMGLRESIDAASSGDINDADVALKSGADDPEYITGRVAAIEYDGQARRVID